MVHCHNFHTIWYHDRNETSMSNNNFQALFSTFKAALGTDSQQGGRLGGGESKTSDVGERNLTVKERIHQQWRITQIQQARPSSSSPKRETVKKVKVAICAVIVDSLKYEEIWRKWQSSSKSSECKFIVHAKYPERIRSPWLRRHTLPFSHRPNWNDVRVVKAMIDTLKEAVKDDDVTHTVCFHSNSSVVLIFVCLLSCFCFERSL